jgi:hypothetical protein
MQVQWQVLPSLAGLSRLRSLVLVGLSCTPADGHLLAPLLAGGAGACLTRLVLGDGCRLTLLGDEVLRAAVAPHCSRLQVLDLSGCMDITSAGEAMPQHYTPAHMPARECTGEQSHTWLCCFVGSRLQ